MLIVGGRLVKLVVIRDSATDEILASFSIHNMENYNMALKWIDNNAYENSGFREFDDSGVETIWVNDMLVGAEEV